nr:TPA_asm: hypothetical protein HUJ06_007486 [Nelumbo nucifera]
MMNKNGLQKTKQQNASMETESSSITEGGEISPASQKVEHNSDTPLTTEKIDPSGDISASESLLRIESHRRRTQALLERFKHSHFFVRIAESDEPLWSRRSVSGGPSSESSEMAREKLTTINGGNRKFSRKGTQLNAVIDRGNFDASVSGGVARNTVKCCALSNGDIVVLLGVNVGVNFSKDPILDVLQFEKYQERSLASGKVNNFMYANQDDPCGELLKWLLPLDRSLSPPARLLSPASLNASSTSQKSTFPGSSGSQLFSFGNLRSYSMSSLPPNTSPPLPEVTTSNSKPNFELEDWDRFLPQKSLKSQETGSEERLSFRGVSLEPERFSVHCGLEGIYIPGRRWRRKLEIIQPVEIHSFTVDCNTEDLLCVQIKNICPANTPDIVIFVDAISIVFEEAPKSEPPHSLPIACIEAGNDYSLPNIALRKGEEYSFILKPVNSVWSNLKGYGEKNSQLSHLQAGRTAPSIHLPSRLGEGKRVSLTADKYAVLVSCRCNYTESRLFFKKPTSWKPRVAKDLMISVASEMSQQTSGSNGRTSELPVQVLTLQASNLTSEDLTLTVLAPASFTSPPTVVSLNSVPSTPMSPFVGFSEFAGRVSGEGRGTGVHRLSSSSFSSSIPDNQKENSSGGGMSVPSHEETASVSDVIPSNGLGCTHLWLQSTLPLGCVPAQSTATVKLELLPLTDGIITLDTLQVHVREKGRTYIPEHSLKINATTSIRTGII